MTFSGNEACDPLLSELQCSSRSASIAAIGRLDEFNPASDSVTAYVERAQLFMQANNVPDDKQVVLFLSALGGKTYSLLRNLLTPTLPREKTFDEIVVVLKIISKQRWELPCGRGEYHSYIEVVG